MTLSLGTFGGWGNWWTAASMPSVWNVTATGPCGLNGTASTAVTQVMAGAIRFPTANKPIVLSRPTAARSDGSFGAAMVAAAFLVQSACWITSGPTCQSAPMMKACGESASASPVAARSPRFS